MAELATVLAQWSGPMTALVVALGIIVLIVLMLLAQFFGLWLQARGSTGEPAASRPENMVEVPAGKLSRFAVTRETAGAPKLEEAPCGTLTVLRWQVCFADSHGASGRYQVSSGITLDRREMRRGLSPFFDGLDV